MFRSRPFNVDVIEFSLLQLQHVQGRPRCLVSWVGRVASHAVARSRDLFEPVEAAVAPSTRGCVARGSL